MKPDSMTCYDSIDCFRVGSFSPICLLNEVESNLLSSERLCELWSDLTLQVIERFNAEKLLMQQIKVPEIFCLQQHFEQNKFLEELVQLHFEIMHFIAPPLNEILPIWLARFKQHVFGFDSAMKAFPGAKRLV